MPLIPYFPKHHSPACFLGLPPLTGLVELTVLHALKNKYKARDIELRKLIEQRSKTHHAYHIISHSSDNSNAYLPWSMYEALHDVFVNHYHVPTYCYAPMLELFDYKPFGLLGYDENSKKFSSRLLHATWLATQGIYRFDPIAGREIANATIHGTVPTSVLKRLPEWAVFIETESDWLPTILGQHVVGFFAGITFNRAMGELLLLQFVTKGITLNIAFDLSKDKSIKDICLINSERQKLDEFFLRFGLKEILSQENNLQSLGKTYEEHESLIQGSLSLLLALCAKQSPNNANSMISGSTQCMTTMNAVTGNKNASCRKASSALPNIRHVKFDLGLKGHSQEECNLDQNIHTHHTRIQSRHIRRAHWHGYYFGSGTSRNFQLVWVGPTVVNASKPWRSSVVIRHVGQEIAA